MKRIVSLLLFILIVCSLPAQPSFKKLHEIKKAEDELAVIDQEKQEKENEKTVLQNDFDKKLQTFNNYHASHGSKATESQVSICDSYASSAQEAGGKLEVVKDEIKNLEQRKKAKEDSIYNAKTEFVDGMKIPCASGLTGLVSYAQLANCWQCFFDGTCNEASDISGVAVPEGTKIIPNGAPGSFGSFRNEQLARISAGINKVEPPSPPPPQKGMVEQATEKVRDFFRDIIKEAQRLKSRITAPPPPKAVGAPRG